MSELLLAASGISETPPLVNTREKTSSGKFSIFIS